MRSLVSTLALVCLAALGGVCQSTDAASDRIVVVGNKAQPVQWNHRETIQEAINLAKPSGTVIIPTNYPGSDCNPLSNCNPGNVCVIDWRINGVGTGNCNGGNGGGGGGGATPGGSDSYIQFNSSGTLGGAADYRYDRVGHNVFFPDGSAWNPAGLVFPSSGNLLLSTVGTQQQLLGPAEKSSCVGSGDPTFAASFVNLCSVASTNNNVAAATMYGQTGDGKYLQWSLLPGSGAVTDGLGYNFSAGSAELLRDGGSALHDLLNIDRATRSVHFYGALNFPNAAGTGNTFGAAGAVPVSSGGSGTPTKFSNEITGTYVAAGSFGVCPSPPSIPSSGGTILAASVSSICFGPSGHIKGSWAGDAYDDLVRVSNIPSGGIQCCIGLSQLDTAALDARYDTINTVPQYNIPEGGAAGTGLQASPCNDSATGVLNCNTVFTAGAGIPNDTSTGTTLGLLAKLSAGKMVKIGTGDTNVPVFLITNNAGTTGNTWPLFAGIGSCTFDPTATVAGDFVGASSTDAAKCADLGSSFAAINGNHAVIGQVLTTNGAGGGTYSILLTQAAQTPFYQTIKNNGSAQTQRSTLNLKPGTNVTITAADNSGAGSTDVTINSSGGGGGSSSALRTTSDFTTTSASLVAISDLDFTMAASTAANYNVSCDLIISNNVNSGLIFGVQAVTTAPTSAQFSIEWKTNVSAFNSNTPNPFSDTSTHTLNSAFTPAGTVGSKFSIHIFGTVEQPSGSASVFHIMADIASGNTLTVYKDSTCRWQTTSN
jgi:hypothetical protein